MEATVVTITLSKRRERAESTNDMLDAHARAGEGGVEGAVVRGARARARLPAWRGAGRMAGFDPDVGEVAQDADVRAAALRQPGRAQQFRVVGRATDARRDVDDPAALIDG